MCRISLPGVLGAGPKADRGTATTEATLVDLTGCLSPASQWEQGLPVDDSFPESAIPMERQVFCSFFPEANALHPPHMAYVPCGATPERSPLTHLAQECAGLESDLDYLQPRHETNNCLSSSSICHEHHPSKSLARRRRRHRTVERHAHQQCNGSLDDHRVSQEMGNFKPPVPMNSYAQMLAHLESGGTNLLAILSELRGTMRRLIFDPVGCRIAQLLVQEADHKDAAGLCAELQGCVWRAITSPHGNYVIQKIIEVLPASHSRFIVAELLGYGAEVSRHRYGCRVMCRLVEHSSSDPLTSQLVRETIHVANELCRHEFAHHVLESILEHGLDEQKHGIALGLQAGVFEHAWGLHGSYVMESALRNCSSADREALVKPFLADWETLNLLANHLSGVHVLRAILKYSAHGPSIRGLLHQNLREESSWWASSESQRVKSNL